MSDCISWALSIILDTLSGWIELNWIDGVFVQVWLCVSAWALSPQFDTNNSIMDYQTKETSIYIYMWVCANKVNKSSGKSKKNWPYERKQP